MRVAFQGEVGAYSEQAAVSFFGAGIELLPLPDFRSIFEAVAQDRAHAAVVPIENSLAGSVHQNYDLLLEFRLPITGEIYLRIRHHLMALPGVRKQDIRRVISHPQALEQCREFLQQWPDIEIVPYYDTAGSAKRLREANLRDTAAIASHQAALEYDLNILASEIESDHQNFTRFLTIEKQENIPDEDGKTSIVFATKDIPGALFKSLAVFALRDINLQKLESRPLLGRPFQYLFYLDFEGSLRDEACRNALNHLGEITRFLQVLGSYRKGQFV
ncbi:MAG: prephenate dehydratase [candidate division KSB1 bacterium]|nr:prephenate dehydratase [candidate division KSB1 bacterium]